METSIEIPVQFRHHGIISEPPTTQRIYSQSQQHKTADRLMIGVSWLLLLYAFALASWYNTWTAVFWFGLPAVLIPTAIAVLCPGSRLSRAGFGAGFMILSALHIHQAHGMIEMHFGIFMLLAFLLYYRDWLPIVFAAGIIAVHHLAFNYLQVSTDIPVYVFTANTGLEIVLLHAAHVVFESAILVVMSIKLRREAQETEDVYAVVGSLLEGGDQIDLRGSGHMPGSLIGRALHNVMTQTRKVMQDTGNVTRELDETSTQMSTLAESLAKNFRTEEANTEQATSAVSEATTAVQQVATCAREAAEAAANVDAASRECSREINDSRQVVEHLSQSVRQAGERVSLLNEDSQKIGSVLDVISSVAEQTNLLALNAAIEAARAGEHGRGFAVVADEVRQLAGKTQQSAQEIQNVIEKVRTEAMEANESMVESRKASEDTVKVFDALAERLHTIASGIERINVANTQTAEAAVHQQQLMENGNNGMLAIRNDILASSDEVSHLARVSGNLRGLAEQLTHHAARFSV